MIPVERSELITYRGVFVDSKKCDSLTLDPVKGQKWIETGNYVDEKTGKVYPLQEVILTTELVRVWKRGPVR